MARDPASRAVYAALAGNLLVAVTKFGAAAVTHSSAMLSEAVHSLVDTANQVLMLYGLSRSRLPPDEAHPLGYGREVYFWSFVVSLLIFALGAGVSIYEGIRHVLEPRPIENPVVNYVVLALAAIFEAASWSVALRTFRAEKGNLGYLEAAEQSKDPAVFIILFEDSAALLGILFALAGTAAAHALDLPVLDGVASIAIGCLLAAVAVFLARESKQLLIGERARPALTRSLCSIARSEPGVEHANGLLTVHVGPRQVVAALSVDFSDSLSATGVEQVVARLGERVRKAHPEVVLFLVNPQSADAYRRTRNQPAPGT
jgi:cation diffusion facilitator family transporter